MHSSECGFRIADFGNFIPHSTFCIPQLKGPSNPCPLGPLIIPAHLFLFRDRELELFF